MLDLRYDDPNVGSHEMRKGAVALLKSRDKEWLATSDIYAFGVGGGYSMVATERLWDDNGIPVRSIHAFDSFIGFPEEEKGIERAPEWKPGVPNLQEEFATATIEETIGELRKRLTKNEITYFHPGFYGDVLNDQLFAKGNFSFAQYVDIDCDLYISTKHALSWLKANNLLVRGTLIAYHDWGSTRECYGGESRAHYEILGTSPKLVWMDYGARVFEIQ